MGWRLWLFIGELSILVGLGVALVVWLVRGELRERRRKRIDKQMRAQFGRKPPALPPAETPSQPVTVGELIARTKAEGLATKLRRDQNEEGRSGPDDEWPTVVLPRMK